MKPVCHNKLNYNYNARDAIEDLELAIRKAEASRNTEAPRTRFYIGRKW